MRVRLKLLNIQAAARQLPAECSALTNPSQVPVRGAGRMTNDNHSGILQGREDMCSKLCCNDSIQLQLLTRVDRVILTSHYSAFHR